MTDLKSRKIKFLRTHIDPSIGTMPRNAFNFDNMEALAEITPIGVYVKIKTGEEYLVPFSNIQSIRFLPEEKTAGKGKLPEAGKTPEIPPPAPPTSNTEAPAKG